jgi:uncharacterized protein YkvS
MKQSIPNLSPRVIVQTSKVGNLVYFNCAQTEQITGQNFMFPPRIRLNMGSFGKVQDIQENSIFLDLSTSEDGTVRLSHNVFY